MNNPTKKTLWQDGFWAVENMSSTIFDVKGETWDMKSLIALDYPDMVERSMPVSIMKFGDFGGARKEITDATGAHKYNLDMLWWGTYKMQGVVDDNGTAVHYWDEVGKIVGIIRCLTPETLQELKDDRDDINAPR